MRLELSLFLLLLGDVYLKASGQDFFNYDATQGRDYGPPDWDEVSCSNNRVGQCVSAYNNTKSFARIACSLQAL